MKAAVTPRHSSSILKLTSVRIILGLFGFSLLYALSVGIMQLVAIMSANDPVIDEFCLIYPNKECDEYKDDIYNDHCCGTNFNSPGYKYGFALVIMLVVILVIFTFNFGLCALNNCKHSFRILKINLGIPLFFALIYIPSLYAGLAYSHQYDLTTGYRLNQTNYCSNLNVTVSKFQAYVNNCQQAFCFLGEPASKYTRCPLVGVSIIIPTFGVLVLFFYAVRGCVRNYWEFHAEYETISDEKMTDV
jgi:hypothetical protein